MTYYFWVLVNNEKVKQYLEYAFDIKVDKYWIK